jgi:hypothetical protein
MRSMLNHGGIAASIPKTPGAWPGLGHAAAVLRDPLGFLTSLGTRDGLVLVWIGPAKVVVCDADLTP